MSRCYAIKVRLQLDKIQSAYGLGASGKGQKYLARQVRQRCDKYVPKDTGLLKNTATITAGGHKLVYPQRYARKQFYVNYHHADPNRGTQWHRRMLRREKSVLVSEVGRYLKRRPG